MKPLSRRGVVRFTQRGLTLIELMVSITIGLLIVGAMSYLYIGTRGAYRTNENLARLQESGRFALDWLARDIRMAGFSGCAGPRVSGTVAVKARPAVAFGPVDSIVGYDRDSSPTPSGKYATGDWITVRYGESVGVNLDGSNDVANATLRLVHNCLKFKQGDYVLISDCQTGSSVPSAYVIRITNEPDQFCTQSNSTVTLEHALGTTGGPGNGDPSVTGSNQIRGFDVDSQAKVYRVEDVTYFVGTNPSGRRSLYRISNSGGTEEVVEGVEDLDVSYGLDTSVPTDGVADEYKKASALSTADWANVVSVRLNLLAASPEQVATQPQTYVLRDENADGKLDPAEDTVTAPDRKLRRVFSATIALRNRQN
jgi:type IV pilus assembly protein PilW